MRGTTHAIVGMNAAWIGVLFGSANGLWVLMFPIVGAIAGLLPDIDAGSAKIHFVGGGVLGVFRGVFTHRGFFHSLLALALFTFGVWAAFGNFHPVMPFVAAIGYASHLVIDGWNFAGARYLFPLPKKYHLVPKWLASSNGGAADQLFFVLGAMGILVYLLSCAFRVSSPFVFPELTR